MVCPVHRLELSQSMARFGCRVTCFEMSPQLLPREGELAISLFSYTTPVFINHNYL